MGNNDAATQHLAVKRIATLNKYSAPLVLLSDTAQQTALPLFDALVRESLNFGFSVVLVCINSKPSADISVLPNVNIVDFRPTLSQLSDSTTDGRWIDFSVLGQEILDKTRKSIGISNVLVAIDSIELLLRTSTIETASLLRAIRKIVSERSNSRVLARFPRDSIKQQQRSEATASSGMQKSGTQPLYNMLTSMADAVIDVHPLDALPSWMPGWYSNDEVAPFIALKHNDATRGLLRMEYRKQSGKIGHEVASFEIDEMLLPVFQAVEVSPPVVMALQNKPSSQQHSSQKPKQDSKDSSQNAAKPVNMHQQSDPAAGLSFNLNLTEKQRKDKANVELPYLEAQVEHVSILPADGKYVGGEIHYQLDETDDWDDEDDLDDDLEI